MTPPVPVTASPRRNGHAAPRHASTGLPNTYNWTIVVVLTLKYIFSLLSRRFVVSPNTFEAITKEPVEVTAAGVASAQLSKYI